MTLSRFPFVLLVDDDRGDQKLTTRALAAIGKDIALYVAGNAEEALAYLQGCRTEDAERPMPHVILLDLNMPGIGGKGFLKRIKTGSALSRIPVFVLTTSDSEADKEECYELGAAGYIQKPASKDTLREVVTRIVEHWSKTPTPTDGLTLDAVTA